MEGKVHRVTYNMVKGVAVLHMEDGGSLEVKMSPEEWKELLKGDISSNFGRLLDE